MIAVAAGKFYTIYKVISYYYCKVMKEETLECTKFHKFLKSIRKN